MPNRSSYEPPFHGAMTLDEAKPILREHAKNGGDDCPLCAQFVKVYKRKVHATMAVALILLYKRFGTEWGLLKEVLDRTRYADSAKLRYWGLLMEDQTLVREDGSKRTGWWRVTEAGAAWVRRETTIPKYALVYNTRALGYEGEQVSIVDCLGDKFDYNELMSM
jgi:hypothetical protein